MRSKKVVIIGLDAPIAYRVYEYAKKGFLPNLAKLMREGVYAINFLNSYPTVTPQNWTSIATGANVGTHGITGFTIHLPGEDLTSLKTAFNSSLCKAEFIWNVVEEAGGYSIVVNWPCSWPPTFKRGWQIGGYGLSMNEWRRGRLLYEADLCDGQLFTTLDLPYSVKIVFRKASGWKNLPDQVNALEAEVKPMYSACVRAGERGLELAKVKGPRPWFILVLDYGEGFVELVVSWEKDYKKALCRLREGEWSPVIVREFEIVNGKVKGAFKCKLVELSRDASRVRLFTTPICNLEFPTYPKELVEEIIKVNPLAFPSHIVYDGLGWGWFDEKTFLELVEMEHKWFSDILTYLMRTREWKLVALHMHGPDWFYHYTVQPELIDPSNPKYVGKEKAEKLIKLEIKFYRAIDKAIGEIVEVAGPESLIVVVSDHGIKPRIYGINVAQVLAEAGLLVFKEDGSIDYSKSKAIPGREGPWIYVNLKDRFSHGIVNLEEYEKVREAIINTLYGYVDPKTGLRPFILALKKEDARILGLYGPRIGDVVYALRPEYGPHHGQLPTAEVGIGSLKGLFIMKGPGVKKNYVVKRTVRAIDVVPTICYLTGLRVPRNTEGAVIYQALEGFPDEEVEEDKVFKLQEKLLRRGTRSGEPFQVES